MDPKGVVLTNENVTALVRGMDLFMEQFEDKVNLVLDTLENCYDTMHFSHNKSHKNTMNLHR